MTSQNIRKYELDPTGVNPHNRIEAEEHVVTEANFGDYHVIIPKLSPFSLNKIEVFWLESGTRTPVPLRKDRDYFLGYQYYLGTRTLGVPFYGGIVLNKRDRSGIIKVNYNTLGGNTSLDRQAIHSILADLAFNPRKVYWDELVGVPLVFTPDFHTHKSDDLTGVGQLTRAILKMADTLREKNVQYTLLEERIRTLEEKVL